jgi:hypothetical protein
LMRRSTDGGTTWGELQTLAVGNLDFYVVVTSASGMEVRLQCTAVISR